MAYDKHGREKLGRIASQIESISNKAKKENRDYFTSEERERYHGLQEEFTRQEAVVAANEGSRAGKTAVADYLEGSAAARNGGISEVGDVPEVRDRFRSSGQGWRDRSPYAAAFDTYIRGGLERMGEEHRAALQIGLVQNAQTTVPGTGGGYTVPQGFSYLLEEAMKFWGGIDGVTGEFETETGAPLTWPTVNDTTNMGRFIGENVQNVETDLTFGQLTFNTYTASSDVVLVPLTLLQDSAFDVGALLANLLGQRLGRLRNKSCTIGTGSGEPKGIITAAVASGLISQLPTGNVASFAYGDLVDLEHAVDPAYRYTPTSRWMFNDTVLKKLKELVDGNNRPLWSPGLTASFQDGPGMQIGGMRPTILGHEYIVNPWMADPAASAYSILFGCMNCFKVRKLKSGVQVLRLLERYADYLQQGFIAFERYDANLIDAGTHPIAVLQQSAS